MGGFGGKSLHKREQGRSINILPESGRGAFFKSKTTKPPLLKRGEMPKGDGSLIWRESSFSFGGSAVDYRS